MKYRNHSLFYFLCLAALLTSHACKSGQKKSLSQKPNVVFILVDDLGWSDCGFMGSTYYSTPNLDKLASESKVFTRAYAGAANCAPSRAALMSGMQSPRTGIYTVSPSDRGNAKSRKIIPVSNTDFLADSVYTMAEMFHDAGYVTGHFGKWHLGNDPLKQGFDVNFAGGPYGHPKSYFAPYIYPNLEAPEGEYLTDRITKEAIAFIDSNKHKPFFLYLPFYTVHTPIQGKEALIKKYKKKTSSANHFRPDYAAMVESMDYSVGRLLKRLEDLNLKNTIIVFTSDNGGIYSISKQLPLRAGKGTYYEGGIRVPLTVKWQGHIEPNKSDVTFSNLDFYPTFKEIIKAELPSGKRMDGQSFKKMWLDNKKIDHEPLFFHFPIYLQAYKKNSGVNRDPLYRTRPGTAVIDGEWKLIHYYEDNQSELFNLTNDLGETRNLVSDYPEKAKELKTLIDNWIVKTNAPVPSELNAEYDKVWDEKAQSKFQVQ